MLKIAWTDNYVLPLPPNHRFPMSKYEMLPLQLMHEGTVSEKNFFQPSPVSEQWIKQTHDDVYWKKLQTLSLSASEIRRTGFPLSAALIERETIIANGTILATEFARHFGIAMNIAGGTHHAFTDRGEGFCLLNDQAMATNYLLQTKTAQRILIIDLDVHQGNGTAQIFREEPNVFTFSMHGANNYPLIKEKSDLDIGLPDGTNDSFYLKTLQANLDHIMEHFNPDFLFFQAGVDVLATDKLGKLGLSLAGCRERDRIVLNLARQARIPLVVSMGGGYSTEFNDIIEAHANTYRLAQDIFF